VADDGTHGRELWKSNGTAAGTVMVLDINTGKSQGSDPGNLTNLNDTLLFAADDGKNGGELWKSDGTAAGTVMVKDINPGKTTFYTTYCKPGSYGRICHTKKVQVPSSSGPSQLINVNGTLYFFASGGTNGNGLWKSDGTSAGTVLVKD